MDDHENKKKIGWASAWKLYTVGGNCCLEANRYRWKSAWKVVDVGGRRCKSVKVG